MATTTSGGDAAAAAPEVCCICRDTLADGASSPPLEECGHCAFHVRCIVRWFRSGNATCPLCRSDPSTVLGFPDVLSRASMLRQRARRKTASAGLKRAVACLQRAEEKSRKAHAEYMGFMGDKEVKRLRREWNTLRRARWRARASVNERRRQLGLFEDGTTRIPAVGRKIYRRTRRGFVFRGGGAW